MSQLLTGRQPMTGHKKAPQAQDTARITFGAVLWIQGVYYLLTGVWPLVCLETLDAVTGPSLENWLVRTGNGLVAATGLTMIVAASRKTYSPELGVLGMCSAIGLGAIDVICILRGFIDPIYMLDAAVEGFLVVAWIWLLGRDRSDAPEEITMQVSGMPCLLV